MLATPWIKSDTQFWDPSRIQQLMLEVWAFLSGLKTQVRDIVSPQDPRKEMEYLISQYNWIYSYLNFWTQMGPCKGIFDKDGNNTVWCTFIERTGELCFTSFDRLYAQRKWALLQAILMEKLLKRGIHEYSTTHSASRFLIVNAASITNEHIQFLQHRGITVELQKSESGETVAKIYIKKPEITYNYAAALALGNKSDK